MKTGQVSSTALLIARSLLMGDATPAWRPLLVGDSAALTRRVLSFVDGMPWGDLIRRRPAVRAILRAVERLWTPGAFMYWLTRKRWFDFFAREALDAGCRQIVVLGAGLDTLAQRYHEEAVCFELDHPATQEIKRAAFPDGPVLVPLDLIDTSTAALLRRQPLFDPAKPTFYVCEGLFMYLPIETVASLLRELAELSAPGSRLAFSYMEAHEGRPLGFQQSARLSRWWLRWRGESFRSGLAPEKVAGFLREHGWELATLGSPEETRRRMLAPFGLADASLATGESVASARLAPR
ncbi:MAG TPA: SAM-dependent methyltransferase [Chthoniobacteraceae bacterium]|jgi:methyltransferase (TIGR00027 family)|nr:SAM-dependent methyltransferase [Chthoniobacteraceae bacterium]